MSQQRDAADRSRFARPSPTLSIGILAALTAAIGLLTACDENTAPLPYLTAQENHPVDFHPIMPMTPRAKTQLSSGAISGEAPVQPIAFPHDRHVQIDGIQCQYCHSAARNSIHGGVPDTQVCMGCHRYVLKESPEIKLVTQYYESGTPIPWTKVHDLPDFVYFSHMRHVRAGVECTECHGQVQTMAGKRVKPKAEHEGEAGAEPAAAPEVTIENATEVLGEAHGTMTREATLQMGWCLDCHASHPSIDTNYKDKADLRRAELKDCWTCHK
jgi:hypothetical protein